MEIWKELQETDLCYLISNLGRIKSKSTGKIIKQHKGRGGYLKVSLTFNRKDKTFLVHRLVAKHFIANPEGKTQVNHIDCNKTNNCATNLEWCTPKENVKHAIEHNLFCGSLEALDKSKQNRKKKIIAKNVVTKEEKRFDSVAEAERYFNTRHICSVIKGQRKTAKGYTFQYAGDANAT